MRKNKINLSSIFSALEGVLIMLACYLTIFLKPLRDKWGMTKERLAEEFPGDDIIADPRSQFTHGIDIKAPAEFVWPWVAQMGKDRAGFYSYELLENILGLEIYNSDKILDEFQSPQKGDLIPFGPDTAYPLVICDQGKAMVIENFDDLDTRKKYDPENGHPENYLHLSWLWFIESVDAENSRFVSRNRLTYKDSYKNKLIIGLLSEPIVFAMDRKMCLGIKKLAERHYRSRKKSKAATENATQDILA